MFNLKFILVAILIFLGCALAQSLQGEAIASNEVVETSQLEEVKERATRWRWNNNKGNGGNDDDEDEDEDEEEEENNGDNGSNNNDFPPCQPPKGSTVRPTSAPSTPRPTTRPTNAPSTPRPTNAPSTPRPTNAPSTPRPTNAPSTPRPTNAPSTPRPTNAPSTPRPTNAPSTPRPTNAPSTPRPTNAPSTPRPTNAPSTPRPTNAPSTPRPTNAPSTPRPTNAPSTPRPTTPPSGGNYGLCDVVPATAEPLKMLLPLYVYPGSSWDQIVSAASKVDIIAIINPNSGPGSSASSTYISYMNKLNAAGVEQIGYVYTQYGARSASVVKADIDIYVRSFPHIVGIFFDEASNKAADVAYYRELYNYVISKGLKHSILNPGTQPDQGYLAISTNIVIFEDYGNSVTSKSYPSFVKCASSASQKAGYKYKFSGIAHTTSSSNMASYIKKFQDAGMGMVYVTDGAGGCCTYNNMVNYFAAEITAIQSLNN